MVCSVIACTGWVTAAALGCFACLPASSSFLTLCCVALAVGTLAVNAPLLEGGRRLGDVVTPNARRCAVVMDMMDCEAGTSTPAEKLTGLLGPNPGRPTPLRRHFRPDDAGAALRLRPDGGGWYVDNWTTGAVAGGQAEGAAAELGYLTNYANTRALLRPPVVWLGDAPQQNHVLDARIRYVTDDEVVLEGERRFANPTRRPELSGLYESADEAARHMHKCVRPESFLYDGHVHRYVDGRYVRDACRDGYGDKTRGAAKRWVCGRDCPGGAFLTDASCNCACVRPEGSKKKTGDTFAQMSEGTRSAVDAARWRGFFDALLAEYPWRGPVISAMFELADRKGSGAVTEEDFDAFVGVMEREAAGGRRLEARGA